MRSHGRLIGSSISLLTLDHGTPMLHSPKNPEEFKYHTLAHKVR